VEKERERGRGREGEREGMLAAAAPSRAAAVGCWAAPAGALRPRLAAEMLEKDGANENGRGWRNPEATRFLHPSNSIYRR
jgi:hypothetical protein